MLKQLVNEAQFTIRLRSETPLLVKSDIDTSDLDVDMSPVVTRRNGSLQPYIPGSSAKGALRSHAERIARTLAGDHPELGSCDPFADKTEPLSCSKRMEGLKKKERNRTAADDYAQICPVCKLFGCLSIQSRVSISDFYAADADQPSIERRDGVGIDRFTGGSSSGALFNMAVAVGGKYTGTIRVRNFEIWQLGLIAFLLRDLMAGVLTFGMGRSRGLGQVVADDLSGRVRVFLPSVPEGTIAGLGSLEQGFEQYGFSHLNLDSTGIGAGVDPSEEGAGVGFEYQYRSLDEAKRLLKSAAPAFPAYMAARLSTGAAQ